MLASPRRFPPFHAEHIGSLRRPDYLLQKRADFESHRCSVEDLRQAEDSAIVDIVQLQREAGIKSLTDGEFRRFVFFDGVFNNLDGMRFYPQVPEEKLWDYLPNVALTKRMGYKLPSYMCDGKIKRARPFYKDQFKALRKVVSPEEVSHLKITMCAPEWYHVHHGPYAFDKGVYSMDEEYFANIAVAYRAEIRELYELGCRNIQFDDPLLLYFCAESVIEGMSKEGVDHKALLDLYCRVYNGCLDGKPADMNAGIHLCRGNYPDGSHVMEGSYDRMQASSSTISTSTVTTKDPSRSFSVRNQFSFPQLEYDTDRAGSFEPLKFLPLNKTVVLGVVSTKIPQLEEKDQLKERVHRAAQLIAQGTPPRSKEVALNQVCISPQCGFSSSTHGGLCNADDMKQKLRLVAETAKWIWLDA